MDQWPRRQGPCGAMPKPRHWAAGLPPTHPPKDPCPSALGTQGSGKYVRGHGRWRAHCPHCQVRTPPGRSGDGAEVPLSLQAFMVSSGLPRSPRSSILFTQQTPSELGLS